MRDLLSYVLAGLFGGLLVFGGIQYYHPNDSQNGLGSGYATPVATKVNESPAVNPTVGPDFSIAAEKALNVVVQINAQESERVVKQKESELQRDNPFFNHPLFRDFDMRSFGFGMPYYQQKKGSGSGVIISNDGYVVTNNHVVEFADEIEVILKNGKSYKAQKIGTDARTDLAVLKIEESGLPVLQMANSDQIKVGEWVLAVGNPFGYLTSTVTAGIVSAKGRDLNIIDENQDQDYYYGQKAPQKGIEEFIQTDAAVNPGNSGGALVDAQGRLVGINSAIASKTGYYSGYSFAIPVNLMNKVVKELMTNGTFERGKLGVVVSEIDEESIKELNLSSKEGVVIENLEDNSSAKYAGLRQKDVIVGVNDKPIKNYEDLQKAIGLTKVGETLNIKIIRDGVAKEVAVKIRKGV